MGNTEDKTLCYYDEHAAEWAEAHHGFEDESFWKEWMQKLSKLLPSGKVLEIGSGAGKDAINLIKLGYDYVGTDASKGLLKIAQGRNSNSDFRNIKVQDLDKHFQENEFDGFWTAATLLHVPKDEIDYALQNIHTVVKGQGVGFVSIKQGKGEQKDEKGRLFSYYSQNEFANLLGKHGFEIIEQDIRPMTEKTIWLIYLVRVKK